MKYLLTGASGFLGKHILDVLTRTEVNTLGRSEQNDIVCNLGESIPELPQVDVVIHCAGKAHMIPKTPEEIEDFFKVNTQGTKNLLLALEHLREKPKQLIFISSVSVYGLDSGEFIKESFPLAGKSPYAESKILAEEAVLTWAEKNNVPAVILRLPLLIGNNPPGNLGKMIRGIKSKKYASINNGRARKSMVLAHDVATLIQNLTFQKGIYNLTDRYHPSFNELEQKISEMFNTKIYLKLPLSLVKILAKLGDRVSIFPINSALINKMTLDLTFDDSKAVRELNWSPNKVLDSNFQ